MEISDKIKPASEIEIWSAWFQHIAVKSQKNKLQILIWRNL